MQSISVELRKVSKSFQKGSVAFTLLSTDIKSNRYIFKYYFLATPGSNWQIISGDLDQQGAEKHPVLLLAVSWLLPSNHSVSSQFYFHFHRVRKQDQLTTEVCRHNQPRKEEQPLESEQSYFRDVQKKDFGNVCHNKGIYSTSGLKIISTVIQSIIYKHHVLLVLIFL